MTAAEMRQGMQMAAEARDIACHLVAETDNDAVEALVDKLYDVMGDVSGEVGLCALASVAAAACLMSPDPPMLSMTLGQLIATMIQAYAKPADAAVH